MQVSRAREQSEKKADWGREVELHKEKKSYLEGQLATIYRRKERVSGGTWLKETGVRSRRAVGSRAATWRLFPGE